MLLIRHSPARPWNPRPGGRGGADGLSSFFSIPVIEVIVFAAFAVLAMIVLYRWGRRAWYLHVISVVIALVIALTPIPSEYSFPQTGIVVGVPIAFLIVWGLAAPLFTRRPHPAEASGS